MKRVFGYVFLIGGSLSALLFLISFIMHVNSDGVVSLITGTIIWEAVCYFFIRLGIKWTKKKVVAPSIDDIGKE